MTYEQWRHTVATDLDGAFVCIQRAARRMVAGGTRRAVHRGHQRARAPASRRIVGAYDAAKHGLGGLVKTAALELGQFDITANAVAPGEIATPMTDQADEDPTSQAPAGGTTGTSG